MRQAFTIIIAVLLWGTASISWQAVGQDMSPGLFDHQPWSNIAIDSLQEAADSASHIVLYGNSAIIYGTPHFLAPETSAENQLLTPVERQPTDDWKLFFFVGGLLSLAIARYFYGSRIGHFFRAASGSNFFNQMEREGGFFDETVTYLLFFNFLVVFSLLLWQTVLFLGPSSLPELLSPLFLYLITLLITSVFFLIKSVLLGFLGWVFNTRQASLIYLKNLFMFNQLIGIILLPIVGYLIYSPSYGGIIIIWSFWLLANMVKIFRGALVGYNQMSFSGYYLFLYLCSVELVPFMLIVKLGSKYLFTA